MSCIGTLESRVPYTVTVAIGDPYYLDNHEVLIKGTAEATFSGYKYPVTTDRGETTEDEVDLDSVHILSASHSFYLKAEILASLLAYFKDKLHNAEFDFDDFTEGD